MVRSMVRQTFDVDWVHLGNGYIRSSDELRDDIIIRVKKCTHCVCIEERDSSSGNGFHIRVGCDRVDECWVCRMVFDSPSRVDLDDGPPWTRGVLWDRKTYVKGCSKMVGMAGPWGKVL